MPAIKTIKIKSGKGFVSINESDYDELSQELYNDDKPSVNNMKKSDLMKEINDSGYEISKSDIKKLSYEELMELVLTIRG